MEEVSKLLVSPCASGDMRVHLPEDVVAAVAGAGAVEAVTAPAAVRGVRRLLDEASIKVSEDVGAILEVLQNRTAHVGMLRSGLTALCNLMNGVSEAHTAIRRDVAARGGIPHIIRLVSSVEDVSALAGACQALRYLTRNGACVSIRRPVCDVVVSSRQQESDRSRWRYSSSRGCSARAPR